jgi:oligopeptidase B
MSQEPRPAPPIAARHPQTSVLHGETRIDDYAWLRLKEDAAVRRHLEAENAHTEAVLGPLAPLRQRLFRELVGRIQETDVSAPVREGEWLYYTRTQEGLQYPIYCRRPAAGEPGDEQVLLDLNALGEGLAYIDLGAFEVSDDARLLAYSVDVTGFREYTLHVKDLASGELLPDRVENVETVAWAADNRTLFYTVEDEAKRPWRLHRRSVGAGEDAIVFHEADESMRVYVGRTLSHALLVAGVASHTTSEWRILPADRPTGDWRLVAPRRRDHEYDLAHHGDWLYIRTNDRGRNFRLVRAPLASPGPESWQELVPHREAVMLEDVLLFAEHRVLLEREDGLPRLVVSDLDGAHAHAVALPETVYSVAPGDNRRFETGVLRYVYESFVTPRSVYDYDMRTRRATLVKQQPVLGDFDASRYASTRLWATAGDRVRVPISLVWRKDRRGEGPAPLHLYGYGAYGIAIPAGFSSNRLSLLDRGVVFAVAHVRGGGELGKPWHDAGRMHVKANTFGDFIAAAEQLIRAGWTSPDRLTMEGASAGGLLVGAVLNRRPELFRAAIAKVPFVDVINTMLDESLPLTVGEFEEWGNPKLEADYRRLREYSPYDNVAAQGYPALLVRTSLNDSQVMYWEPAKWVAKLRVLKTDSRPLLLHTNMEAGHSGASGRYDYLREVAFDYAFLLWQLGLTEESA